MSTSTEPPAGPAIPDQPEPDRSVAADRSTEPIRTAGPDQAPILPSWARDRLTFQTTVRNAWRRNAHLSARWAVRGPGLLVLLVAYAPRGLARIAAALGRYLYDYDSAKVRHELAGRTESAEYVRTQAVRKANLRARWMVAGTVAVAVAGPALAWTAPDVLAVVAGAGLAYWIVKLIPGRGLVELAVAAAAGGLVWWFLPAGLERLPQLPLWPFAAAGAAAVLALGWHGRPRKRPLVRPVDLAPGIVAPVRAPMVQEALCQLGISGLKDPDSIRLLTDVHRHGPGVQVDLELPGGVPATAVIAKREQLAAALKRELGTVWPTRGKRHAAHLVLYIADQPMAEQRQAPWPLAEGGRVDIFQPLPQVTDQRGSWVKLTLAYCLMVIGAVPRMGKTFVLRQLLIVAALDPRTRIYALDGKGTGDLAPLRHVAHFYSVGDEPEEVVDRVLPALRELRQEMRRRAKFIRDLPTEEAPENKVTSALADRYRELAPIVLGIDETQAYFGYGAKSSKEDKRVREELAAIVTDLAKRGPALGFIVLLATQNVCEETIPRAISTNAVIRAALKLFDHTANDQVLGTGAYSKGIDATVFDVEDKGLMWLRADGGVPQIVRSVAGLDAVEAERLALIARAQRAADNRLTGQAAGEHQEVQLEVDLLDDVREVMDTEGRNMSLTAIREALALLRPNLYGHLDNAALGGLLRGAGVEPDAVWCPGEKRTATGLKREWLRRDDDDGRSPVVPIAGT